MAEGFSLIGIWDRFYNNIAIGENTSTHYVNRLDYSEFQTKPQLTLDDQHVELEWFDLSVLAKDEKLHPYIRNYAS